MLRRRIGGISEGWASGIEYWLQGYLDNMNWELDEEKTYHYLVSTTTEKDPIIAIEKDPPYQS